MIGANPVNATMMPGTGETPLHGGRTTIRPSNSSEWQTFRDFRLAALRAAPGVFAASYESDVALSENAWRETIAGADHQVFGLFANANLIGITAVFAWNGDPTGQAAILAMSFIVPEFRGRGLSRLLYDARIDWIRSKPQFKRIVVSHRLTNDVSRRANQRYGFKQTHTSLRVWPDGTSEDEIWYELRLL